MATTMKAVDIRGGKGERDALFINSEFPKPTTAEGQVLVKVKAFGINQMDILQRRGLYPLPPQAPSTLGVEFSGTVDSVGPGAEGFSVGEEVFGLAYGGAYAEYIAVSAKMLLRKPATLGFEQCAAIPETWITATQALHLVLGFTAGKSILWHAGASGVSIAGIQLSRAAGASAVYATAGSDAKCEFATSRLGATAAFNYKTQNWAEEVHKATGGKGVDFIVDFIGGSYFNMNLQAAARDGRVVMLGLLGGGQVPEANIALILGKRLRIEGSTLRSRDPDYQGRLRDRLEEYIPKMETGELEIIMDQTMPWEQVSEAHKHLEESKATGKVVCTIS